MAFLVMLVAVGDDEVFRVARHAEGRNAALSKGVALVSLQVLESISPEAIIHRAYFAGIKAFDRPLGIGEIGIKKDNGRDLIFFGKIKGLVCKVKSLPGRAGREDQPGKFAVSRGKRELELTLLGPRGEARGRENGTDELEKFGLARDECVLYRGRLVPD